MSENHEQTRSRWPDAVAAALALTATKRALLLLLARLPLSSAETLLRLHPEVAVWTVRRSLNELGEAGLIAAVHAPTASRRSARLWHLTDLGLAAIASDQGADPENLARSNGLGRSYLLTDLRHLPAILALHRLLGALATGGPGVPRLREWQRPWRGTYPRPYAGAQGEVRLPARASFAWGAGDAARCGDFLLIADRATAPLRDAWREPLTGLFPYNAAVRRAGRIQPTLLIATTGDRAPTWRALLADLRAERREVPLLARVVTWDALDAEVGDVVSTLQLDRESEEPIWPAAIARTAATLSEGPLPRLVGGPLEGIPARAVAPRGPIPADAETGAPRQPRPERSAVPEARRPFALSLSASEWALLDLIARHPLLTRDQAARALGWGDDAIRRRRGALLNCGLVRLLTADELAQRRAITSPPIAQIVSHNPLLRLSPRAAMRGGRTWRICLAPLVQPLLWVLMLTCAGIGHTRRGGESHTRLIARQPLEATRAGLTAVAAWQGLTLPTAVARNGLAGGGPEAAVGARTGLLAAPRHTLGVNELFATLADSARTAAQAGQDAALVEWRNASACARKQLRPDGYFIFRRGHSSGVFFLEYDRSTMGRRDWHQKLAAYYAYRDSGAYRRDYDGFPTLLIVIGVDDRAGAATGTRAATTEDRLARILRDLAVGRTPLSALLTTEARIAADPGGLRGPIWRVPDTAIGRRCLPP